MLPRVSGGAVVTRHIILPVAPVCPAIARGEHSHQRLTSPVAGGALARDAAAR